jgi:choloylglycine hydrolase
MTGMNEAGLAASQMWLDEARYATADERPTIGVVEWIQYVLDTSATVDEALANIRKVRIESKVPLHYKLMDAQGHAAVVEFLDGEAVIRSGDSLPLAALANDTYARSLQFAGDVASGKAEATGSGSLARFTRASLARQSPDAGDPITFAFTTLADVAHPQRTQWSIVYDTARRIVHWRTRENEAVKSVDLGDFDLSCATPTMLLGIHEGKGEVARQFRPYRSEDNERLLVETVRATPFLAGMDDASLHQSALWPATSLCRSE